MVTMTLRLPESLSDSLRSAAADAHTSVNAFAVAAIKDKLLEESYQRIAAGMDDEDRVYHAANRSRGRRGEGR